MRSQNAPSDSGELAGGEPVPADLTVPVHVIRETANRYLQETMDNWDSGTEFTMDELDIIRNEVQNRFQGEDAPLLRAYTWIEREFAKGHRCPVCGQTGAQSIAANYDCWNEC